jgi:hypothetical protein
MDIRVGLCSVCRYARVTGNRRGSVFYLCSRAEQDSRLRRYPPLPVLGCPAFQPDHEAGESGVSPAPSAD